MIDLPSFNKPSVVVLGNFDGVHLGHQQLLQTVVSVAREKNLSSVALFFYPHPVSVLSHQAIAELSTMDMRRQAILSLGIQACETITFTKELSRMSAKDFLCHLTNQLHARVLVLGPTTHIGHHREGTPEKIRVMAQSMSLDVMIVDETLVDAESVSSSKIRAYLEAGLVNHAARLLGRPYETAGEIIKSRGLGTNLGFPTLNLAPVKTILPAKGVYLTQHVLAGAKVWGVTNVGVRPTLPSGPHRQVHVETHLLVNERFETPKAFTISWITRLRDEQKFSSKEALIAQISADVLQARKMILE